MIETLNLSLSFGGRKLFENVNIRFTDDNCYGIIGANGAGKSTFLQILSGEISPSTGSVIKGPNDRIAVLKQNHFEYDDFHVIKTVFMGHQELYKVMEEKEALYEKSPEEFTEEDGIRLGKLEGDFAGFNGWEAEAEAAILLNALDISNELHNKKMKDLLDSQKVKVLLAQALFGNPEVLLLDEPTNHLDAKSITWLEEFLLNYKSTVIVVSHDRHFLNKVCTHIADIDYEQIVLFTGNYEFWKETSELARKLLSESNKKKEDQIKELEDFVRRFSANASKSKQATSRKKQIEKITLDDIKPSSRRYPYIRFECGRDVGKEILSVKGLTKSINGEKAINGFDLLVTPGEKVAFVGEYDFAKTALLDMLSNNLKADSGTFAWGQTTSLSYLPKDNSKFFDKGNYNLVDWLRQFSEDQSMEFLRGSLGRMLFGGEDALKKVNVLSGGEKMRLMYSKMMLSKANVLLLDGPTDHLDLESIVSVNGALEKFKGVVLINSHDHSLVQSVANRIIEFTPNGVIDKKMTFDEYLENKEIQAQLETLYEAR
ncbi:MAG: ABC transporter ATP-binding protein [Candidatus Melainabacteria bacterium RIFCSPHIGHO2_02_FULL_34_12]|nr:MAG: ABC transporter ATP-binding protein [Candidatus Melainabacteria bacterium RIFCSPHIGHO2_02_FULL_34_12]